jgi:hypothetical protein
MVKTSQLALLYTKQQHRKKNYAFEISLFGLTYPFWECWGWMT